MNESLNFTCRYPGETGNGLLVIYENNEVYVCETMDECTHIICKACSAMFTKEQWFSGRHCQSCGR